MIPKIEALNIGQEIEIVEQPSLTYGLNMEKGNIFGYKDGLNAMKQAIYKILQTERYRYEIYNWNYGIETADLFGKPVPFVCSELKRRIEEALQIDDRITGVDEFVFKSPRKKTVSVRFLVHTVFGDVAATKEVTV